MAGFPRADAGPDRDDAGAVPLALALPAPLSLAAVVVVTQTLVELIGMVIYVRLVPGLVPEPRVAHTLP